MNKVILCGRLVAAPELKTFNKNDREINVCNFKLAVTRPARKDAEQKTDFIKCTAYGNNAKNIAKFCDKGSQLLVDASFRQTDYEKDGVKHYDYTMEVNDFDFIGGKGQNDKETPNEKPVDKPAASGDDDELPF